MNYCYFCIGDAIAALYPSQVVPKLEGKGLIQSHLCCTAALGKKPVNVPFLAKTNNF